jgi:hypothetical protein
LDNQYFTNLYIDLDEDPNSPGKPVKFDKSNSKYNESTPTFTADGKPCIFTNYIEIAKKERWK